jgi:hypothetical protein
LASEKNTCCRGFVQTNWDWLTLKLLPEKHRIPAQKKATIDHIFMYIYIYAVKRSNIIFGIMITIVEYLSSYSSSNMI